MSSTTGWDDDAILRRLQAAEASLLLAKQAAVAWQRGHIPTTENAIAHAVGTNAINAGIAAADVICEIRLGQHNISHNHRDSIILLRQADPRSAPHLQSIIDSKNMIEYSPDVLTLESARILVNHARDLYDTARQSGIQRGLNAKPQSPRPL